MPLYTGSAVSLGPADAILVASDVQQSQTLATLDLSANAICGIRRRDRTEFTGSYAPQGIRAIGVALTVSTSLRTLDLTNNALRVSEAWHWNEALLHLVLVVVLT